METDVEPSATLYELTEPGSFPTLGGASGPYAREIESGEQLGHYQVLDRLGAGGMGAVFAAEDPRLDRRVAIKLLHRNDAEARNHRLRREAWAMARLEHPNVVTVHDVGEYEGRTFIAMELVDGVNLRRWLEAAPRRPAEILDVFIAAGRGLAAAHAAGVVHRDFKPGNVLVANDGRVLVTDFGLARLEATAELTESAELLPEIDVTVDFTRDGAISGTPGYMAPEQWTATPALPAADQFAFCIALYEALMGAHPFGRGADLYLRTVEGRFQPAKPPSRLAARLLPVLRRGLRPEAGRRWESMASLLRALERGAARRPRRRWAVLGMLALGAVGLAAVWPSSSPCEAPPVEQLWGSEVRDAVHDRFEASSVSFASAQWDRVSGAADEYVDHWRRGYEQVCEAAVDGTAAATVLDARMSCLRQRRVEFEAAVEVLADADDQVVLRANRVLPNLAGLEQCEQGDPAVDPAAIAFGDRLALALARERAGHYQEAHDIAAAVIEDAQGLDVPGVLASAHLRRGSARDWLGRYELAREDLEAAFLVASESGAYRVAMHGARLLGFLVGIRLQEYEAGSDWLRHATALADRVGATATERASIERSFGNVASERGDLAEAEEYYESALALYESSASGLRDAERYKVFSDLGGLAFARGDYDEMLDYYQRAHVMIEADLPQGHTGRAHSSENLGVALVLLGRATEGERWLREALKVRRETLGEDHPSTAKVRSSLGLALSQLGEEAEALEQYEASLAATRRQLGETHPQTARAYANTGSALLRMGKYEKAVDMLRHALRGLEEHIGPTRFEVGHVLARLGEAHLGLSQPYDALPLLERSLAIVRADHRDPHLIAAVELGIERALVSTGGSLH
ncbi:MAG: tetratricopeptide repeat protein [Myxococcota bacterium]